MLPSIMDPKGPPSQRDLGGLTEGVPVRHRERCTTSRASLPAYLPLRERGAAPRPMDESIFPCTPRPEVLIPVNPVFGTLPTAIFERRRAYQFIIRLGQTVGHVPH